MSSGRDKRISEHTERKAGTFLFDISDFDKDQALDMRTRVKSESMMNVLLHYGILSEGLEASNATKIKGIVERLLIAYDGGGRTDAVEVLRQNFPRRVEVRKGYERGLDELRESVKEP